MMIEPALPRTGIVFYGKDIPWDIPARIENVVDSSRATVLDAFGLRISTVEHLLAALYASGIDNARVYVDGPEVPIMDGSCIAFMESLNNVGVVEQSCKRITLRVLEKISIDGISIEPYEGFGVDYTIDYHDDVIGRQQFSLDINCERFGMEIASARTFGWAGDVEALWAKGKARGASTNNVVVIDNGKVANIGGLRYKDEFVRHKILDLVGDFALLGFRVKGWVKADCAGHLHHHNLIRKIMESERIAYES